MSDALTVREAANQVIAESKGGTVTPEALAALDQILAATETKKALLDTTELLTAARDSLLELTHLYTCAAITWSDEKVPTITEELCDCALGRVHRGLRALQE